MPIKRRTVKKTSKKAPKTASKNAKNRKGRKTRKQRGGYAKTMAGGNSLSSIPETSIIPFQGGNQLAPYEHVGENSSMPGGSKTKKYRRNKKGKSRRVMKGGNIFNPYSSVMGGFSEIVHGGEISNMPLRGGEVNSILKIQGDESI